jgi:hypothetical protein
MASNMRRPFRAIVILLLVVIVATGVLCFVSHRAVVEKANASYSDFAPASARWSRFKVTGAHTFSIFWKLRFAKESKRTPSVAIWHARPFGAVELQGGQR